MEKKVIAKNCLVLLFIILLNSCSIKYDTTVEVSDVVPEFVFEDTKIIKYEDKKIRTEITAKKLEEYKGSNEAYATEINFSVYDSNAEVTTEGQCGYLYADTDKKLYQLYDEIQIKDVSENTEFYADAIKWNGKTEQLISRKTDKVKIKKDDTVMEGVGFSASGISKTFRFLGTVDGEIETK